MGSAVPSDMSARDPRTLIFPVEFQQVLQLLLLEHLEDLVEFYGEYQGVRIARRHIGWYSRTHPGGAAFRRQINLSNSPEQQQCPIKDFFDRLAAKEVLAA